MSDVLQVNGDIFVSLCVPIISIKERSEQKLLKTIVMGLMINHHLPLILVNV